ncbi:hypothetical protein [Paenibacillus sp. LK1]|uniref:hypothetical protein n=1 Tax=Paenibacillus sp. LK1 TaxID=2053014 RepID=UPI000C19BBFB|nr:hypothetical protein [Paenibacillus sp. LK1]PIH55344.1 hypothetical protein CS562_32125 [Paenibacillus sp. LK1]
MSNIFNFSGTHNIVKLNVFPWYGYRNLQNYSFVFSTFTEGIELKGCSYVQVKIIHDSKILAMDRDVLNAEKFRFKEGNLVVNEFIEIIQEKTRFQTLYIAVLKGQVTPKKHVYVGKRNLLLYTDNKDGEGLSDKYAAYYGKEFEASVKWQEAELKNNMLQQLYILLRKNPDKNFTEQLKLQWDKQRQTVSELHELYAEASRREYMEID